MKRFIFAAICIIISNSLFAQAFNKDSKMLGITGGLDGLYIGDLYTGLNFSYDQGYMETAGPGVISLGGSVGLGRRSYSDFNVYSWNSSRAYLAFRGAYHYNGIDEKNLDIYGGLEIGLGLIHNRYTGPAIVVPLDYSTSNSTNFYLRPNPFIGARYFVTDNFGIMAETSMALFNGLNIGVTFKL